MMQVVSPYRAIPAGMHPHDDLLAGFDWIEAARMLAASVRQSCDCDTWVITDQATTVPVPSLALPTTEPQLMLWILEVSLRFLESAHFDRDTVFVSPDTLVFGPLAPYFAGDLSVIIRPGTKYARRPIINSVQWWPVRAQRRLVRFYERALTIARGLSEGLVTWGADSEPLRQLLAPIVPGRDMRSGLDVRMIPMGEVMHSLHQREIDELAAGRVPPAPTVPIVDFRYTRKLHMPAYYQAFLGSAVPA